ncbi:hypothetical protein R5W23_002894, partial [Gemmata sp. JC673]
MEQNVGSWGVKAARAAVGVLAVLFGLWWIVDGCGVRRGIPPAKIGGERKRPIQPPARAVRAPSVARYTNRLLVSGLVFV